MNKIYGYDDKLMIKLIDFMKKRQGENLTALFKEFSIITGKSGGTIRNLYYAIAKKAELDVDFKRKYLGDTDFKTGKVERFTPESERELLKSIMQERLKSRSTRSAVMRLSGGDGKVALRYQNKYRSALKNNTELLSELADEIYCESGKKYPDFISVRANAVSEIKEEINNLVEKISASVKRENERLKSENAHLKREVERLTLLTESNGINYLKDTFHTESN